jgi:hypothetical protein
MTRIVVQSLDGDKHEFTNPICSLDLQWFRNEVMAKVTMGNPNVATGTCFANPQRIWVDDVLMFGPKEPITYKPFIGQRLFDEWIEKTEWAADYWPARLGLLEAESERLRDILRSSTAALGASNIAFAQLPAVIADKLHYITTLQTLLDGEQRRSAALEKELADIQATLTPSKFQQFQAVPDLASVRGVLAIPLDQRGYQHAAWDLYKMARKVIAMVPKPATLDELRAIVKELDVP